VSQSDEPKWVSRADVEATHATMIEIGGGSYGLRDEGLLESALARPHNLHAYGESYTFQLAASYAEGIARNHPFVDGNKRTALATADLFLADNGQNFNRAKGQEHAEMMEKFGQGQISREEAAGYLKQHSQPLEQSRSETTGRSEDAQQAKRMEQLEQTANAVKTENAPKHAETIANEQAETATDYQGDSGDRKRDNLQNAGDKIKGEGQENGQGIKF